MTGPEDSEPRRGGAGRRSGGNRKGFGPGRPGGDAGFGRGASRRGGGPRGGRYPRAKGGDRGRGRRPGPADGSRERRPAPDHGTDARRVALNAIDRWERTPGAWISDVLPAAGLLELDRRSRRFAQELTYGILRRRLTLDCIIDKWSRERVSQLDPDCLQVLRLGVYQLLFLDGVPPFAAISQCVELIGRRHPGVRGMVNAVLREIDRSARRTTVEYDRGGASPRKRLQIDDRKVVFFPREVFADPEENLALHLAQQHSHPPFLVERWLRRHDRSRVEEILRAGNSKPRVSVRVNRLKADREGLLRRFDAEGIPARPGMLDESVIVDASPAELTSTTAFRDGLFYI